MKSIECENCGSSDIVNNQCSHCGTKFKSKKTTKRTIVNSDMGRFKVLKDTKLVGDMNVIEYAENCEIKGDMNKIKRSKNITVKGDMNEY